MELKQKIFYFAGTPIGNWDDITVRALKVLKESDFILAESIRSITTLLKYHHISFNKDKIVLYDEKRVQLKDIKEILINSNIISYVSDAGMPVFMDPGSELLNFLKTHSFQIKVIPGVSSLTTALVYSGINEPFFFAGFPPRETKERFKFFKQLSKKNIPIILYEAPFRTKKLLEECKRFLKPDLYIEIYLNLTKEKEKIIKTKIKEIYKILQHIGKEPAVIIIKKN